MSVDLSSIFTKKFQFRIKKLFFNPGDTLRTSRLYLVSNFPKLKPHNYISFEKFNLFGKLT